mmetsp:Transcript_32798/g.54978  ORF Transcript_32798/g.54978 Transcript_32798/m.54978 type:complete len:207 (+) Transcript_32798:1662-2282(+)|eukprot:CAMPEP_0178741090 /NCGR_PEP_ID=MMETSP0744-20121128/4940_1 /TAXON_ID=913974 /ORGANISM="Nitzschia punctata, Strain CCMP561" /LENGTH=206 /DNA_ID=CAMNT_0020393911 /DNA_START=124 /DNA_END=744 /DNA_ORIENTATION=+
MAEEETNPPAASGEETKEEEKAPEEESTAHFEPVVKLEEVEVESGEEQEEVIHTVRAKLYIYGESLLAKGTGEKSWNERGVGDAKILKHREHGKLRLLQRQEKTMKVICNHVVDPRIKLEPNVGTDRSWVWSAFDFAEGELKETVFAMKFKDKETAEEFKKQFEEAQKAMETLESGNDGAPSAEADEAAEALAGLSTKTEGEEAKE